MSGETFETNRRTGIVRGEDSVTACPSLQDLAAKWKTKEQEDTVKQQLLKEDILIRIRQATNLIKETSSGPVDDSSSAGHHIEKMEWDSLYELSANVMDDYTRHVDSILADLDQLHQKQYLWQESAFVIDSHRGAAVIGKAERWMKLKEQHLDFKLKEFDRSASVIKSTIERLTTEK